MGGINKNNFPAWLFFAIRHPSSLFATIRHHSPLFATIRHYSPLFATIRQYSTLLPLFVTFRIRSLFARHKNLRLGLSLAQKYSKTSIKRTTGRPRSSYPFFGFLFHRGTTR